MFGKSLFESCSLNRVLSSFRLYSDQKCILISRKSKRSNSPSTMVSAEHGLDRIEPAVEIGDMVM